MPTTQPLQAPVLPMVVFVTLVLALVTTYAWAAGYAFRSRGSATAWRAALLCVAAFAFVMLATTALAELGVLRENVGKMQLLILPLSVNAVGLVVALSPIGKRLAREIPLWALVGFQAFRLPLELVLHALYQAGALPVQMTYEGSNWDIVTGILALAVGAGLHIGWLGRGAAWAFNLMGFALLINVVRIAVRSLPTPVQAFEEPLLLPLTTPFVWILPVCVAGALMGHVLAFRALLQTAPRAPTVATS